MGDDVQIGLLNITAQTHLCISEGLNRTGLLLAAFKYQRGDRHAPVVVPQTLDHAL